MQHAGRCLCGAVRFAVEHVETEHHACHCGMCRRWSGGPFFVAEVHGLAFESTEHLATYASSEWAQRGFCRVCGTTLYYYLVPAKRYMMSVGAFDDSSAFRLVREIFVDRKPDGYAFAGEHSRWTEAETFERLSPPKSE